MPGLPAQPGTVMTLRRSWHAGRLPVTALEIADPAHVLGYPDTGDLGPVRAHGRRAVGLPHLRCRARRFRIRWPAGEPGSLVGTRVRCAGIVRARSPE